MKGLQFQQLFQKLEESEKTFFSADTEFLSPVVANQPIRIKLQGITLTLKAQPQPQKDGWGIFRPTSSKTAQFIRPATLTEKQNYLSLYPQFNCIVYQQGKYPKAVLVQAKHKNIQLAGGIIVKLSPPVMQFEGVRVSWDGANFWGATAGIALGPLNLPSLLRAALNEKRGPESIKDLAGITPYYIEAYRLAYEEVRDKTKDRLEGELKKRGAKLVNYVDRGETYTVTYSVDGKIHTSTINSGNLQAYSAGFCLSGGDRNYDLGTLIHVIREGEERGLINRLGDYNYDNEDEDYE